MRLILALLACLAVTPAAAQTFRFMTEELPPLSYTRDGALRGISVDIVREAMRVLDHPQEIEVLPWVRALATTRADAGTALFSTARTAEREPLFKWAGPLVTTTTLFLARKGRDLGVKTLADAARLRVGITAGSPVFNELQAAGFTSLDPVSEALSNPRKLRADRIELWLVSDLVWPMRVREASLDVADFEPALAYGSQHLYIAFNLATPDGDVARWQGAIDSIRAAGKDAAIRADYVKRLLDGQL